MKKIFKSFALGLVLSFSVISGTAFAEDTSDPRSEFYNGLFKYSDGVYYSNEKFYSINETIQGCFEYQKSFFDNSSYHNFGYIIYNDGEYYRFMMENTDIDRMAEEDQYVDQWLKENMPVVVPEGTDGIQALDLIYQWIINNTEYEVNHPASDWAYTALKGENVSCIGYANLFDLMTEYVPFNVETGLSDYSGNSECWHFDTKIITDDRHGWNGIDINGTWYYFDVTFDDGGRSKNMYFMKTEDEFYNGKKVDTNNGEYLRKNENLDIL